MASLGRNLSYVVPGAEHALSDRSWEGESMGQLHVDSCRLQRQECNRVD